MEPEFRTLRPFVLRAIVLAVRPWCRFWKPAAGCRPLHNARKLIRIEGGKLVVGNKEFEPTGSPRSGDEVYDLSKIRNIYVVGAGKGIQNVARPWRRFWVTAHRRP